MSCTFKAAVSTWVGIVRCAAANRCSATVCRVVARAKCRIDAARDAASAAPVSKGCSGDGLSISKNSLGLIPSTPTFGVTPLKVKRVLCAAEVSAASCSGVMSKPSVLALCASFLIVLFVSRTCASAKPVLVCRAALTPFAESLPAKTREMLYLSHRVPTFGSGQSSLLVDGEIVHRPKEYEPICPEETEPGVKGMILELSGLLVAKALVDHQGIADTI